MTLPVALQLYSVREEAAKDYAATIRAVAAMGYAGVEPAGFPGSSVEAAAKLYKELGLAVPSAHCQLPVGDVAERVLDDLGILGCTRCISGKGPKDLDTIDHIKATCELFNQAAANCRARGFQFGIHNHWWEYLQVDGRYVYEIMLDQLDRDVVFEMDTYWVQVAGPDPAEILPKLGARVPLLHIKDGPCVREAPMTAAGDGKMNFPKVVAAGKHAEWLIVELDRCATDMMEAVRRSFVYLVASGLGRGK